MHRYGVMRGLPALTIVLCLTLSVACGDNETPSATPTEAPSSAATAAPAPVATPAEIQVPRLPGPQLVETLRGGGLIVIFRHALTDMSQSDREPFTARDCTNQRNLSAAGRTQATMIGEEIRRLGIPYDVALSSPYCRTKETAGLAFGVYDLTNYATLDRWFGGGSAIAKFYEGISRKTRAFMAGTRDADVWHGADALAMSVIENGRSVLRVLHAPD